MELPDSRSNFLGRREQSVGNRNETKGWQRDGENRREESSFAKTWLVFQVAQRRLENEEGTNQQDICSVYKTSQEIDPEDKNAFTKNKNSVLHTSRCPVRVEKNLARYLLDVYKTSSKHRGRHAPTDVITIFRLHYCIQKIPSPPSPICWENASFWEWGILPPPVQPI